MSEVMKSNQTRELVLSSDRYFSVMLVDGHDSSHAVEIQAPYVPPKLDPSFVTSNLNKVVMRGLLSHFDANLGIDPRQYKDIFGHIDFGSGTGDICICPPDLKLLNGIDRTQKMKLLSYLAEDKVILPQTRFPWLETRLKLAPEEDVASIMILSLFVENGIESQIMAAELIGLAEPRTIESLAIKHARHMIFTSRLPLLKLIHAGARAINRHRKGVTYYEKGSLRRPLTIRVLVRILVNLLALQEAPEEAKYDLRQFGTGLSSVYDAKDPADLGVHLGIIEKVVQVYGLELLEKQANRVKRILRGIQTAVGFIGLIPTGSVGAGLYPWVEEAIQAWSGKRREEKLKVIEAMNDYCHLEITKALERRVYGMGSADARAFKEIYGASYKEVQAAMKFRVA